MRKWEDGIYVDKHCSSAFISQDEADALALYRFFICRDGKVTRGSPTIEDALRDRQFAQPSLSHDLKGILIFRGTRVKP